jgi:hypothetical protein
MYAIQTSSPMLSVDATMETGERLGCDGMVQTFYHELFGAESQI